MNNKEFISALADKVGRTQDETQKLVPPKLVLNFRAAASIKEKLKKGGAE